MIVGQLLSLLLSLTISDIEFPTCGDCWCIPDGLDPCPEGRPRTHFNNQVIQYYANHVPIWTYTLDCDPFRNSSCQTNPPQTMLDVSTAVCAFKYPENFPQSSSVHHYSMNTYRSEIEAKADGAVVTHTGSCGLCSTAQDLALFLTEDLSTSGKICAAKAFMGEEMGLNCYLNLGLSRECAKLWNYDGMYDAEVCTAVCFSNLMSPNNGPPPKCSLNECLQCDEDKAGPVFCAFSGRTRRRSGLLSEIIRPCNSIDRISHDPSLNPYFQSSLL